VLIGYVRVSTQEQNEARQNELMERLGVEKIFIDKMTGSNTKRPELQSMLDFVRKGDTVIVESISRFARNTRDLLNLVDTLVIKGVEFISQKEDIDTTSPAGKFMLTVFAAVSELERDYLLQRQKEGIEIAKQEGKYKGRKRIELNNFNEIYKKWSQKEITGVQAMKKLGISKSTFYRRIKVGFGNVFRCKIRAKLL